MTEELTTTLIKADVGGIPGHASVHIDLLTLAKQRLGEKKLEGLIRDFRVLHAGDDLELLMTHYRGCDDGKIHKLAFDVFIEATEIAKELKLHGAGQDMLSDAFSGNIRGLGPGSAEMSFTERKSEPIIAFMMDKTEPGAFNFPIYKMFADPFNTSGLVVDPLLHKGFVFEVWDIEEHRSVLMNAPEDIYSMLALIGAKSRYVIKRVFPKEGHLPTDEPVAVISTDKLSQIAGKYVGKDDPVGLVRAQGGLPAVGEVIEPFAYPYLVSGWMRGSHNGPLMPMGFDQAQCTRFDGPPLVIAAGFQIADGMLVGPVDLFKGPAYDRARAKAQEIADYMRRHGPFEPHRLPLGDMEYTTLAGVLKSLEGKFQKI